VKLVVGWSARGLSLRAAQQFERPNVSLPIAADSHLGVGEAKVSISGFEAAHGLEVPS
jgi:hypothetical protein